MGATIGAPLSPTPISTIKLSFVQTLPNPLISINLHKQTTFHSLKIESRANTRKENPKVRNRRMQRKFNGSSVRPRLSVFCSKKQLYAMLVDDQNKKCLFYGSTVQTSIRESPGCDSIAEAAQRVGQELVKACEEQGIYEISSYDRNGFARGERTAAFEIAIARFGFLRD